MHTIKHFIPNVYERSQFYRRRLFVLCMFYCWFCFCLKHFTHAVSPVLNKIILGSNDCIWVASALVEPVYTMLLHAIYYFKMSCEQSVFKERDVIAVKLSNDNQGTWILEIEQLYPQILRLQKRTEIKEGILDNCRHFRCDLLISVVALTCTHTCIALFCKYTNGKQLSYR